MAVKTFTTGEKLTASDTNTYLNNGGLVYVTETSFSAATQVLVDNCFTSTYANYRVLLDLSALSANDTLGFQWRTGGSSGSTYTTADYDFQLLEANSTTVSAAATMGAVYHRLGFAYATPGYFWSVTDIANPQAAFRSQVNTIGNSTNSTTFVLMDNVIGSNRVTTSFTGIRVASITGTTQLTGRLRIYGYRNA